MPEFKSGHGRIDAAGTDATRATAHLPGPDMEIVHRPAVEDDAEQIYINVRAAPSFEAFGRSLEAANPFALWAQVAQLTCQPWLLVGRALGAAVDVHAAAAGRRRRIMFGAEARLAGWRTPDRFKGDHIATSSHSDRKRKK